MFSLRGNFRIKITPGLSGGYFKDKFLIKPQHIGVFFETFINCLLGKSG